MFFLIGWEMGGLGGMINDGVHHYDYDKVGIISSRKCSRPAAPNTENPTPR